MTILLWIGAVVWVVLLLQFLINIGVAIRSKIELSGPIPEKAGKDTPFVSIVVPARDEERAIGETISAFCSQDYPNFEVIVVDDCSTDKTPEILSELSNKYDNLTVIEGTEPPDGWLGKPNALEAGAKAAKGEWLLFADADAVYAPSLLSRLIAYAKKKDAAMVFAGPDIATKGILETALISQIYFLGSAALPMFLIPCTKSRFFAGGTGAGNLVRRDAFSASGAFTSLKGEIVDDVGLGFKVKGAGHKIAIAFTGKFLKIRMYHGAGETVRGLSKNSYPMLKRYPATLPVPFVGGAIFTFLPYYVFLSGLFGGTVNIPAGISVLITHVIFLGIVLMYRQPWYLTFLSPVRELLSWWVFLYSFVLFKRKGLFWRGRAYK